MEHYDNVKEETVFFPSDEPVKKHRSRRLKVHTITWNVNSKPPPKDTIAQLFMYSADIYVISLQEVGSYDWSQTLDPLLSNEGFIKIKSRKLQGIVIMVFVQRHLLNFVTHIESEATKTGLGGMWGNKGAVSVRFDIYGINIIFVNSHLAAHEDQVSHRIQDVTDIIDNQKFRDQDVNCILDHDYVFWMGDMNFRVEMPYEEALGHIQKNDINTLLEHDQLRSVMKEGLIFQDFEEAPIRFKPTYKFDIGTDIYDTSQKKRVPSYTDRVLGFHHKVTYGKKDHLNVDFSGYRSHPSFKESDHKPVSCTMDILGLSKPQMNPVKFKINKTVSRTVPMSVSYTSRSMELCTSDWIGLFHVNFIRLFTDYISYQYAVVNYVSHPYSGTIQIPSSTFQNLAKGASFVLCYFSKKYSFSGVSKIFKIKD